MASLAKKQSFVNSVNGGPASVKAGKQAASEVSEKDGENGEQESPSNKQLYENDSGNSAEDDNNPSNSDVRNVAESTVVSGNLSGAVGQLDTGIPLESGNSLSDSSNIPLSVHLPNLLYPTEFNAHTSTAEFSGTPLNRNISRDGTYHLERIRIPVFAGDKKKYQQWDAAFTSCVDQNLINGTIQDAPTGILLEGRSGRKQQRSGLFQGSL